MNKRQTGKIVALLLVSSFIFTACNRGAEGKAEKVVKVINHKLDLNDKQEAKLNKIKDEVLAIYKERKAQRGDKFSKLKGLVMAESLDETLVKEMVKERHDNHKKDFPKVFVLVKDFHASLNKEQKEGLVRLIEKFEKKMNKHW